MQQFKGRTEDAEAPFLNADFWETGKTVRGVVSKLFNVNNGDKTAQAYVLDLEDAVELNGEESERVSIGNMAGFVMAMQAANLLALRLKDILTLECTGRKPSKKEGFSDRVNFSITVDRP